MIEPLSDRVQSAVRELFPTLPGSEAAAAALAAVEGERVQLAVLALSEGDPARLAGLVEAARQDWRDVVAWAEYPDEMRRGSGGSP